MPVSVMARRKFKEVEAPPERCPLDAWAGWLGEGWGPGASLFVTSGTRGGGSARIYRLDTGGGSWIDEEVPTGDVETINKIRDAGDRLYAYYERPDEGQTWLISRDFEGGWGFEDVPSVPASVGGRGVGINPNDFSTIYAGSMNAPGGEDRSAVSKNEGGGWEEIRVIQPSLIWELEFDADGRLWEFYNNFGKEELVSAVYVDGVDTGPSQGGDISQATWFDGHMYTVGALSEEHSGDIRTTIARSESGGEWEVVHNFETAAVGDHVLMIPRDPPELWAIGHHPLEVLYSLDGTEWNREESIPSFATGSDTNHVTAIAFWNEAVWVFSRDDEGDIMRAFTDGAVRDLLLQVI